MGVGVPIQVSDAGVASVWNLDLGRMGPLYPLGALAARTAWARLV